MPAATSLELDVAALSGTIGAEIRNIDLHGPLDPETLSAVRQALPERVTIQGDKPF